LPIHQKSGRNLQNKCIQMSQRNFLTVVACLFLCSGEIFAQQKNVEKIPVITGNFTNLTIKNGLGTSFFHPKKISVNVPQKWNNGDFRLLSNSIFNKSILVSVEKNHYIKNLSFICRKELQIEKATNVPLRFRLGSLAYTDYLEQKPNAFLLR
jgi:hypothetical protein